MVDDRAAGLQDYRGQSVIVRVGEGLIEGRGHLVHLNEENRVYEGERERERDMNAKTALWEPAQKSKHSIKRQEVSRPAQKAELSLSGASERKSTREKQGPVQNPS